MNWYIVTVLIFTLALLSPAAPEEPTSTTRNTTTPPTTTTTAQSRTTTSTPTNKTTTEPPTSTIMTSTPTTTTKMTTAATMDSDTDSTFVIPETESTSSDTSTITTPTSTSTSSPTTTSSTTTTINGSSTPDVVPVTLPNVTLSETNILLVRPEDNTLFVELSGPPSENLDPLWLVIRDAARNSTVNHLVKLNLTGSLNPHGIYVVKQTAGQNLAIKLKGIHSILIALYADEDSADQLTTGSHLLDALLYSSDDNIAMGLREKFSKIIPYSLVINSMSWKNVQDISFSRCSDGHFNSAFVLTRATENENNTCNLTTSKSLQMKLNKKPDSCKDKLSVEFSEILVNKVISGVNKKTQCGFSKLMFKDVRVQSHCVGDSMEVIVPFVVRSAFPEQLERLVSGYQAFVGETPHFELQSDTFTFANCSTECIPKYKPLKKSDAKKSDDDNMLVTVAVVVSCIGIFLVILVIVVLYMRQKKQGILQFRKTRLDEEKMMILWVTKVPPSAAIG